MPIRARKNQYRGVNAHLHSYFQAHGGWQSFHHNYITYLTEAIQDVLPPNYLVDAEKSLQIRESYPDTGEPIRTRKPEPDVAIFEVEAVPASSPQTKGLLPASFSIPMLESLELPEELFLRAVLIYEVQEDSVLGKPITQIEVLSRTNKPPGEGYFLYHEKRVAALRSGLKLVEIDLLHESDSPIGGMPSYRQNHPRSSAYYIAISDPSPTVEEAQQQLYTFGVDDPIPLLNIPLAHGDVISVDFGAVYHHTFERFAAYSRRIDYEQQPENFDTYSPADQQRIRDRMQTVTAAHQQGADLDSHVVYGES